MKMKCGVAWLTFLAGLPVTGVADSAAGAAPFSQPPGVVVNEDDEVLSSPALTEAIRLEQEVNAARASTNLDESRVSALELQAHEANGRAMDEIEKLNRSIYGARHAAIMRLGQDRPATGAALKFTLTDYPRVEGSTSTHPLGCLLACRLLGADYEWTAVQGRYRRDALHLWTGDGEHGLAEYHLVAKTRADTRLGEIINQVVAVHSGTHQAYEKLIRRETDLGLIARPPSPDELALAGSNAVTLRVEPVALDAFVFIVNRQNPVRNLTTAQLKAVYAGTVTNWAGLGGRPARLTAYQRERNSGSQELMLDLFLRGSPIQEVTSEWTEEVIRYLMGGPFLALTTNPDGIAYSVYYYEHFMAGSPMTRPIAVDGVLPTSASIRARQYPYVCPVVAVIRSDEPEGSPARRLWRWLFTEEGQALIAESGYIPVGPRQDLVDAAGRKNF